MQKTRQKIERAALVATSQGARSAVESIRADMRGAKLGRLGQAIGNTSDLRRGAGVHRRGDGFSASGVVFVRSRSERTRGAIEAYTEGAEIRPVRGRWLWIPSDDIRRVAGSGKHKERVTPGNWERFGLDRKIGPLVPVRGINGYPLLVLKNVGVALSGASRSAKSLTKSGRPRKGQYRREFIVAFIGIPHTSRAARVDVDAIMRAEQERLPERFYQAAGLVR